MKLLDAHVHLTDSEFSGYIHHILNNLRALKIKACSVTVDIETSLAGLRLFGTSNRDVVMQFIGIHPEFAKTEEITKFIEIFDKNSTIIDGIGEIGLDRSYVESKNICYERQKEIFCSMLALAEKTMKPVSVHSRRSLDDILEMFKTYNLGNVLLHWFDGNRKQLTRAMDMGLYVSYGPPLVYSDLKRNLLMNTDKDKFLIETDGPVKYPRCFKGLTSLPSSFLISVVKACGEVLNMSYQETIDTLKSNSESYLKAQL
jgi:TatD DNase family protein